MQLFSEKNVKIICTVAGVLLLCAALVVCVAYLGQRDELGEKVTETPTETTAVTEEATSTPEVEIIVGEDEVPEEAETREEAEHKLTLSDLEIGDTSWAYFIINRTNYIPNDYESNLELEGVWSNGRYYYFDARIADFAECMINDAERDGVTLLVCSAYRSHSSQTANFERQVKAYASAKYSFANAYTYTSQYIAVPGTSEHQTGLAVDFITPGYTYLDEGFENTAAYKWLSENSYKYGFILRYPSSKAEETGINYEPWHFRFIGFEHAEDIYNSGLCLEEYMAGEGSVEFNPMAPLVIPEEPAWYQSYINPPEPETEETTDETDTAESDEENTSESDTVDGEELPDWLQTESESTDGEESDGEETGDGEDTAESDTGDSEQDSDAEETSSDESLTSDAETGEADTSDESTDSEETEDVAEGEGSEEESFDESTSEEETSGEMTSEEDTAEVTKEDTEETTEEETEEQTEEITSEENTEDSQEGFSEEE